MKRLRRKITMLRRRDGDLCWFCGLPIIFAYERPGAALGPSVDHVVERRVGGNSAAHNLRLAHYFCNTARSHTWTEATEAKWQRKVARALARRDAWVAHLVAACEPKAGERSSLSITTESNENG